MITPKPLTDDLAVCAFVSPEELATLAPRFQTIINNRPDAEDQGQPTSAQLEAQAHRLGLDYVHIPVVPGIVGTEQVEAFGEALKHRQGPLLAFCKTGKRSAILWALSQAGNRTAEEILTAAAAAGYDLGELRPALDQKAAPE